MTLSKAEQDQLVTENLAVIGYHVSDMIRRVPAHVQRDELASAGALALVQAARAYDPATGVPFARYAATRIRGAIVDELRSMDWASRGTRQRMRRLQETADRLTGSLGRAPEEEELAQALGTDVADVRATRDDAGRHVVSMDADPVTADRLSDSRVGPEGRVLMKERLRYLDAAVAELPERLRTVVVELFHHDTPPATLAEQMGVTVSRISQLRSQAMEMLRDGMNTSLEPELAPVATANPGVAERRRHAYYNAVAQRAVAGVGALAAEVRAVTDPEPAVGATHVG